MYKIPVNLTIMYIINLDTTYPLIEQRLYGTLNCAWLYLFLDPDIPSTIIIFVATVGTTLMYLVMACGVEPRFDTQHLPDN